MLKLSLFDTTSVLNFVLTPGTQFRSQQVLPKIHSCLLLKVHLYVVNERRHLFGFTLHSLLIYLFMIYSQLRLIEPPVNRFHRLIGSKFDRIYRTELQFGLQYFRLIDFSA